MIGNLVKAIGSPNGPSYGPAKEDLKKSYGEGFNYLAPYRGAGERGLAGYESLMSDPSKITDDPGYQFRRQQGEDVLMNNALARGSFFSGNTGKALTEYGQNYATSELDRALQRYMPLISGGQGAAGQSAQGAFGLGNALAGLSAREIAERDKRRMDRLGALSGGLEDVFAYGVGGGFGG